MQLWECIIDGISVLCTIVSVVAAYKSVRYYKKSKHMMQLVNANACLAEMQKINVCMTDILKLSNPNISRGKNISAIISQKGKEIADAIQEVKKNLSANEIADMQNILKRQDLDCMVFINELISGKAIMVKDGKECFRHDRYFDKCQERFDEVFQYLKTCVEDHEKKLA